MRKFYLTTAIDYPNALPHIGTAYEKICADIIARYKRLSGWETFFVMGSDADERPWVEMWNRRMEIEVLFAIAQTFRNTHEFFAGRIPQVPEWGEVCRGAALKRLQWLDDELADRTFVAGDRFTIADITALVGIDFGRASGIRIDAGHKNLQRWYEAVSSRPSAKA